MTSALSGNTTSFDVSIRYAEVLRKQPFHYRTQIGCSEVAPLQQVVGPQSGPIRKHPTTGTAPPARNAAPPVPIGALRSVHRHRAAELGHDQHRGLAPRLFDRSAQRSHAAVEFLEVARQRAIVGGLAACVSQPLLSIIAMRGPSGLIRNYRLRSSGSRTANRVGVGRHLVRRTRAGERCFELGSAAYIAAMRAIVSVLAAVERTDTTT